MYTFVVEKPDVTAAWIAACTELDRRTNPDRTAFHTVVRITDPSKDDATFRSDLERVRERALPADDYATIETVANTIFPRALAASSGSHADLVTRYRNMYGRVRLFPKNHRDTYFGRLIAYPGPGSKPPIDQLGKVIERLKSEAASRGPMTAAYEVDVAHPAFDSEIADDPILSMDAHVHRGGHDNYTRGFPCLSHCSFQLEKGRTVHLTAFYRYHYMLDKAYGNYIGLGRLLAHVAGCAGLRAGALTVMAGYAWLEKTRLVRPLLRETEPMVSI
ncbi:hypothetical protein [Kribbella sp. NPDC051137]|uniref:hypothetical protein n=1 Tax=Kribbella sp. NPDC051137 TaxID=3155045 RepID=UPI003447A9FB